MTRRFALAVLAAWMVLAAIIVGFSADVIDPPGYLVRPLLVAVAVALAIGLVALLARSWAVPAAAGIALVVGLTNPITVLSGVAALLAVALLRGRRHLSSPPEAPVLVAAGIFLALGVVRALAVTTFPTSVGYDPSAMGPPMIVILLDGYPRTDTLADLGYDNEPFLAALDARGFDRYPDSQSTHVSTHRTLQALLTDEVVTDEPVADSELRAIQRHLVVPPGFVEVDPPVGFVTLAAGPHIPTGGPTDFEAQLIGQSVVGTLVPDWAWTVLIGGLAQAMEAQLNLVATTDAPRVFAHLMAPHPPFFYADGEGGRRRTCWPRCPMLAFTYEHMEISRDEWEAGMGTQVAALNKRLLSTIDEVLARHPDAVIVLFSDHGGRADIDDTAELHRSFLAARTPDHPRLFANAPFAEEVIRTLLRAYRSN